jgi:CheY-like chemotaxis protein
LLLDINMPVMDGLTLLARLRERRSPVRAIIVSAYGDMANIRTAMNRGAFDFVTKPVDLNDLEITINKTLDEIARMRELERRRAASERARTNLARYFSRRSGHLPRGTDGTNTPRAGWQSDFGADKCEQTVGARKLADCTSPCGWRRAERLLERAGECGLGVVADNLGNLSKGRAGVAELLSRDLHAPIGEVVHRWHADQANEAVGQRGTR